MSDSKVFMFPENGYNNNGLGLNGWGGGVLGFILGILLGNGGLFNGGFGGMNGGLANQINNNNNTDLIMNAINGTDQDVRLLATTLNADVNEVKSAINTVQSMIQSGNSALSRQLSECCCENRLLTTQQGYEGRIQTIEQTNQLGSQADRNARSITDAIAAQSTMITKEFCDLKEREMQTLINGLTAENAQLKTQGAFAAMLSPIQAQLNAIKAAQPQTITLPYSQYSVVPTWAANVGSDFVASYWANRLSSATTTTDTPAATNA